MNYTWQHKDWPNFYWDESQVRPFVLEYIKESQFILGSVQHFSKEEALGIQIDLMVSEAMNTSAIEGEILQYEDIRSSVLRHMGLSELLPTPKDLRAQGMGQLMTNLFKTFKNPLEQNTLFEWHRMVMQGHKNHAALEIGNWRTSPEPMQIVSGYIGHERVHFEAPPSKFMPLEMARFIAWFNDTETKVEGLIRAAVAHLYFESIHPFQDGNGRIGRAIAEKALSQNLGYPVLLSLSAEIEKNKKEYYAELNHASLGELEITRWILYFCQLTLKAQANGKSHLQFVLNKSLFWREKGPFLNDRQKKVLEKMFSKGIDGFEGGMSAKKYMAITDCSKATATRDLADLVAKECLRPLEGSGRNTRYELDM